MNWRQLFSLKGVNLWLIGAGIGWNLIWGFGELTVAYLLLPVGGEITPALQVGLLIGSYLGPFSGGWITARMAGDGRGPTYGVVGSLSIVALLIFTLIPTGGTLGLMAVIVALIGGLIGGTLGQPRIPPG